MFKNNDDDDDDDNFEDKFDEDDDTNAHKTTDSGRRASGKVGGKTNQNHAIRAKKL